MPCSRIPTLCLALLLCACPHAWGQVLAYAAGDIGECDGPAARSVAARTARMITPGAPVFVVGDTAYPKADLATLEACYTPTWGSFRPNTYAVPGNHDYIDDSAADFLTYFGARNPGHTWFRAEVAGWWVIGLDSNLDDGELAQQQAWLEQQLLEVQGDGHCIVSLWHHPVFSTGLHSRDGQKMRPAWAALERAGADLVLNGHEHFYESFERKDADGHNDPQGMREIIAGTGGAHLYDVSVKRGAKVWFRKYGLLELQLQKDRYSYAFRTLDGTVRDSGSAQCRRAPAN